MSIHFRLMEPGEEEAVFNIIEKGYPLRTRAQFKWRFSDNPAWDYQYSTVGETEDTIVSVSFLEPQTMKVLDGCIHILVGGAQAVHPDYRRRGFYREMNRFNREKTRQLGRTMLTAYVVGHEFTYKTLKKEGFFPLGSQYQYIKILNVRETFLIALRILNAAPLPADLFFRVRVVPQSEDAFMLKIAHGKCSIEEDTSAYDLELSGDMESLLTAFLARDGAEVVRLFLKREIKVGFSLPAVKKMVTLARILW